MVDFCPKAIPPTPSMAKRFYRQVSRENQGKGKLVRYFPEAGLFQG